jgi:hypothetical protein
MSFSMDGLAAHASATAPGADHKLSDWPDCHLEMRRAACSGRTVLFPMKLLMERHGNTTFADLLAKLRCSKCQHRPAPVYVCAGTKRTPGNGGGPPDWAIQLVADGGFL